MNKKRILIFHVPLGAGHAMAAKALAKVFELKYPDIEVKIVDAFNFLFEAFGKRIPKGYNYVTTNIPFLYKWAYDFYNSRLTTQLLNYSNKIILKKAHFTNFIQEYNPDFIIATNPFCLPIISKTKEKKIIDIPSANVCTDFGFHSLWYDKNINYYFVSTEEMKQNLVSHGANPESIKVTGVPISFKNDKNLNKKEIIEELGFNYSKPVLLIVGGRIKFGKLLKVINGLAGKNKIQTIVVAGRDEILFKKLQKAGIRRKYASVKVFGFIDDLDKYMSVADLILTKAGGLTMAECIAKNLPMLISDIIPGQEQDNVDYAVKNGFAIREKNAKKIINTVLNLFSDKEKLKLMKESCKNFAKPNAAEEIASFIISKIK